MTTCSGCVAKLLGACRGDYCAAERVGIEEEVTRRAVANGHRLGPFVQERRRPLWRAHCERCGLEAAYTIDPEPGDPAEFGAALDQPCET